MILSLGILILKIVVGVGLLLAVVAVLVFIHELGHFTAAKLLGVKVNEFAIGFGKRIWSKSYKGTEYKVNLLPLGGYVSLEGEEYKGKKKVNDNSNFQAQPLWGKAIILMAGIFMNVLFSVVFLLIYLVTNTYNVNLAYAGPYEFQGAESVNISNGIYIQGVVNDSPASMGLEQEDLVISLNGKNFYSQEEFLDFLDNNQGKTVNLGIINREQLVGTTDVQITLGEKTSEEALILGAQYGVFNYQYEVDYPNNPLSSLSHTWNVFAYQLSILTRSFQVAVETQDPSVPLDQVTSVVGVGVVLSQLLFNLNIDEIVNIVALVSISLAFFNLLPLSILDGGQLLLYVIEAIIGKRINETFLRWMNQATFIFLILLSVLILFRDVVRFDLIGQLISQIGVTIG